MDSGIPLILYHFNWKGHSNHGKSQKICCSQHAWSILDRFVQILISGCFLLTDNSHYNYNSRYLFEYVKENLPEITPLFVINDPELRNSLSSKYGKQYFIETENIQGIRQALSAGVWFTSAGLPAYGTGLHKKRLIINLWHGVPLKKIALLDPNLKKAARIYFKKIFSENYTCILTTSHELIPLMARSFCCF